MDSKESSQWLGTDEVRSEVVVFWVACFVCICYMV